MLLAASAQAAPGGSTGLAAPRLYRFVSHYLFFSRVAPPRACDGAAAPKRQTAAAAALASADLSRFKHLTRLLLASMRHAQREQHFGAAIVTPNANYALPATVASAAAAATAATGRAVLPAAATQWLALTRRIALLLLQHIGDTRSDKHSHHMRQRK